MKFAHKKTDKDLFLFEHDGRREFKVHADLLADTLQIEVFAEDPIDQGVKGGEVILAFPDDTLNEHGQRDIKKLYRFLVSPSGHIQNITSLRVSLVTPEKDHFLLKVVNIAGSGDNIPPDILPWDEFHDFLPIRIPVMEKFRNHGARYARGYVDDGMAFAVPLPSASGPQEMTCQRFCALDGETEFRVDFKNCYPVAIHGAEGVTGRIAGFIGQWQLRATACELEFSAPGVLKTLRAARVFVHESAESNTVDRGAKATLVKAGFSTENTNAYFLLPKKAISLALMRARNVPYKQEEGRDFWTKGTDFRENFEKLRRDPVNYILVDFTRDAGLLPSMPSSKVEHG